MADKEKGVNVFPRTLFGKYYSSVVLESITEVMGINNYDEQLLFIDTGVIISRTEQLIST